MLYIHGGNSKQNKLARQIFHFCSESLFSDRENLIIDLYIKKVSNALAWTDHEGNAKFNIEIEDSLERRVFIVTLCHEMIHVSQFLKGESVSESVAYEFESKLAHQFYEEELANRFEESLLDINDS
jgi:hypothetical protein